MIFDITFFIVVGTIGLNIVFGIIVDAFSQLRDEKVIIITKLFLPLFSKDDVDMYVAEYKIFQHSN